MSIKIYDMYKYHGSVFELMQWLNKYRRAYERVATREVSFMIGSCWTPEHTLNKANKKEYVLWMNGDAKGFHFNYFNLVDLLRDAINAGLNDPMNINASVVVYPYKDEVYVKFFGLDFGTRDYSKWLRRHIDKNEKFEDYSYWNNTDEPEDVTREEWEQRGNFFDEVVFKGHHFFNSRGLTFELSNGESLINIARHVAIWREHNRNNLETEFWGEKNV